MNRRTIQLGGDDRYRTAEVSVSFLPTDEFPHLREQAVITVMTGACSVQTYAGTADLRSLAMALIAAADHIESLKVAA